MQRQMFWRHSINRVFREISLNLSSDTQTLVFCLTKLTVNITAMQMDLRMGGTHH